MSSIADQISASFSAQGLMATLGAELVYVARGEVHIALRPRPELSQQHGYVHAGALTSIVDSACGYAALTVAPPGSEVLTVEFKVNFMRPAVADRFVAIARVVKAGKTLSVCQGEVFGEKDSLRECIALMQATLIYVPDRARKVDGADPSRSAPTTPPAASGRVVEEAPMPRLMQVGAFPEEHRAAVRSVAAAMAAAGREPGEYSASVSPVGKGLLEVYARHDRHPANWIGRGDACGRCCVVRYNPRTGAASRVIGIR